MPVAEQPPLNFGFLSSVVADHPEVQAQLEQLWQISGQSHTLNHGLQQNSTSGHRR